MKIIFFEVNSAETEILSKLVSDIPGVSAEFFEEKLDEQNLGKAKDAEIVSVFVNSELKREIINALPGLKFISTRSTGFDHVDLAAAKEKGVKVSNVPAYGAHTVAEFTFALILSLSRNTYPAYERIKEDDDFDIKGLRGFDLFGKTLGVIGMGRIGKNVIRIARGFGMNVLAYDIKPDVKFAEETCTKCVSLEDVLAGSDIVTIHTFLSPETRHLINKNNIYKMKKGAYLINTARGEIVETEALLEAVASGHLAGAGLDVLEAERQLKDEVHIIKDREAKVRDFKLLYEDHVLIDLPQVLVTPHIAFYTKEAEEEIMKVSVDNIKAFVTGAPQNLV
ncbi:MAG TPA: NAD(P)-dependent oxidoreductase [Candidatus Paceibacterota bacterium]|nr:NAD(P)-dependent oxidoreductase [Candidatus Paceibacterota bacterium]